ncbi:MAG: anaerobic ribonucleoside-triphosphate reductase [bacterium]|nr:anaerobic ribonucleoside-triphosphate reductase [bacterium]
MKESDQDDLFAASPAGDESPDADEGVFDAQLSFPTPFVAAPEPVTSMVKRDGAEVSFDRRKIAESIFLAAQSIGGEDRDRAESLASGVAIYLAKTVDGKTPSAQQVQDAVEKVLIEMGHARTALAFARYRDKRARIRKLRKGDMRALLNELDEARVGESEGPQDAGSLFVRTSDERLASWDRDRIVAALCRETGMDEGLAGVIAVEVERQIVAANVRVLTASLVRELVDAKLVEHGLEEYRRKHMRLGVPLYDTEQIVCAPNRGASERIHDPASTDLALAERVKKEYALSQVFSQEVADGHLSGAIHLHDLGFIDRLHSSEQSLAYVTQFGVGFPGSATPPRPPARPETLLAQLSHFAATLGNHFSASVGWPALNTFIAPYLADVDDRGMEHLARMLLFAFAQSAQAERGAETSFALSWTPPGWLGSRTAMTPGGARPEHTYGAFAHSAQQFAQAVLDACRETTGLGLDDRSEKRLLHVTPEIAISEADVQAPGFDAWLRRAAEAVSVGGRIRFVFDRGDEAADSSARLWQPRTTAVQQVTLNLPRVAYRSANDAEFEDRIVYLVRLAARAHQEKRDFIDRLLTFKDVGPLSLLASEHRGRRLLDLDHAVYRVGMVGLNECVQASTGRQLHESSEAMGLGLRIAARFREACEAEGETHGMRLLPAETDDDAVSSRFAAHDLQAFRAHASLVVKSDPITQDIRYTPGPCLALDAGLTPSERARLGGQFHDAVPENAMLRVSLGDMEPAPESIAHFVQKTFYRTRVRRIAFTR